MMDSTTIIGIDPGEIISGFCVIEDGRIGASTDLDNHDLPLKVMEYLGKANLTVVIEDIQPYLGKLSPNTIETAKWIGELKYRLSVASVSHVLIKRSTVKQFVFEWANHIVEPLIRAYIEKKNYRLKNGELRQPNFLYVKDGMVKKAMREYWNQPVARGKKDLIGKHSWQALAAATAFIEQIKVGEQVSVKLNDYFPAGRVVQSGLSFAT